MRILSRKNIKNIWKHSNPSIPSAAILTIAAFFLPISGQGVIFVGKELFETLPDVLDAKLLASALSISKAGAYQLLNRPDFPTLQVGGRETCHKAEAGFVDGTAYK